MRTLLSLFILALFSTTISYAQTIINTRSSVLQPGGYTISGMAFLEEFDDGSLQLRLDENFETPPGPDVRIFLSDDPNSTQNAIEIQDIGVGRGGINHFSGAISFDVPAGIGINQFDFIVFYCVDFRQHWASGSFGDVLGGNNNGGAPTFQCQETIAATTNWGTEATICVNDGEPDVIPLLNTQMIPAGDNYAYIITDGNDLIEKVIFEGNYDFEESGLGINRVYGVSFESNLNYTIGSSLNSITADGCIILSDNNIFLTVTKEDCTPAFECQATIAATTNWVTEATICVNDGASDIIPLLNTQMIPAGDNYAYIITDGNDLIERVIFEDNFDFDGTGVGINRVYGISFDSNLNYTIGNSLTSITADGCAILSDRNVFLTVTKEDCTPAFECQETITTTTNGGTAVTICIQDEAAAIVPFFNDQMIPAGDNYAYIITDENDLIENVVFEDSFNFDGTDVGVKRVYGVSFDNNLNYNIGSPLMSITANGCSILSDNNTFLTVTKEVCVGTISGRVLSQAGVGLSGFEVNLSNTSTTRTAADGSYEFTNIPFGTSYELLPINNEDFSEGVTVFDLILIQRHILGLNPFTSSFQLIAADASNDGRITTFDLVALNRLVLGITPSLSNNQSWRFVNTNNDQSNATDLTQALQIEQFTNDLTNVDFIGIKVGDVSGASANGLLLSESRSRASLQFDIQDRLIETGETVEIPVTSKNFNQIAGYQFTINAATALSFVDVRPVGLDLNKNNFAILDDQTITTAWSNQKALSTDQTLFVLTVKALADIQLSKALSFDANITPAIAYETTSGNAREMDIALSFQPIELLPINQIQLGQNEPNPFVDRTNITFSLPQSNTVLFQVFDATGRLVFAQGGQYESGSHQIELSDFGNRTTGVFYYQLSTADFQATKKMVRQ